MRDDDGHYQITGRVDDVINVKGHRIRTAKLESCMVSNLLICRWFFCDTALPCCSGILAEISWKIWRGTYNLAVW